MMQCNKGWIGVVALAIGLGGCTVYVQNGPPPQPAQSPVVDVAPPPAPEPAPQPYQPPPDDVVTVYHGDLDPYGHWVDVAPYGACWVPNAVAPGWAPYTVGQWVYSDAGWVWVSADVESSWGPVVYHYGSWYDAPGVGWCWVPGVTWAPAWVAWREGGGYMAWAPLPPEVVFGGVFGVAFVNRYVPEDRYVMVDERYADSPNIRNVIIRNNVTIINRTTNITNITIVNGRAENRGVAVENVERATGRQVERTEVTKATTPEEARRLAAEGRPVNYAPAVVEQAAQKREEERAAKQQESTEKKDQAEQNKTQAQDEREKAAADEKAKTDQEQADRQKAEQEKVDAAKAQHDQEAADAKAKADQEEADRQKAAADAKAKADQEQADRQKAQQEKADAQKAQQEQAAADAKAKADQQKAEQEQAAADAKAQAEQNKQEQAQAAADAKAAKAQEQQQKAPPKNPPKPKPEPGQGQQQ